MLVNGLNFGQLVIWLKNSYFGESTQTLSLIWLWQCSLTTGITNTFIGEVPLPSYIISKFVKHCANKEHWKRNSWITPKERTLKWGKDRQGRVDIPCRQIFSRPQLCLRPSARPIVLHHGPPQAQYATSKELEQDLSIERTAPRLQWKLVREIFEINWHQAAPPPTNHLSSRLMSLNQAGCCIFSQFFAPKIISTWEIGNMNLAHEQLRCG